MWLYVRSSGTDGRVEATHGVRDHTCRTGVGYQHMYLLCARQVVHVSCLNLMFGSKLSPPRQQQCTETLEEYYEFADASCPWFLSCLPMILKQRYPDKRITDCGVAEASRCHDVRARHSKFAPS